MKASLDQYDRNEMMLKNENRGTTAQDAIKYFELMAMFLEEMRSMQKELRILIRYRYYKL